MVTFKKIAPYLKFSLFVGFVVFGILIVWFFQKNEPVRETPVRVVEVKTADQGLWSIPGDAIAEKSELQEAFVTRLHYLSAYRLKVKIVRQVGKDFLLRSDDLKIGDVLVLNPEIVTEGKAVNPVTGLTEEQLIGLVLEAGMAAAMAEDLDQSVRFISSDYQDTLGFNASLIQQLLKRAYKEFDDPRIELVKPPIIQVRGKQAVVHAEVRMSAIYRGRHNYLLGDQETPNRIVLRLNKSTNGWKVSSIEGLQPLGFDEQFLKYLGAEIGLPLTSAEQQKRQEACMPCRKKMAERFGL